MRTSSHRKRLASGFAIGAGLLFGIGPFARADEGASDRAQTLFDGALASMDRGNFVEACPKLEESHRLDPAYGSALNLGFCLERLGKLASAERAYRTAARIAADEERRAAAQARLARIEARVHRVRLRGATPSSRVILDGSPVDPASLSDPARKSGDLVVAVDPGEHELSIARSSDSRAIARRFVATPGGEPRELTFDDAPAPPAADAAAPVAASPAGRTRRTIALATGSLGLLAIGGGSVAGLLAADKHADADRMCPANVCTPEGLALDQDADRLAWVSNAALAVGVAAVVTAAVLWFTAPQAKPTRAGWEIGLRGPVR